MVSRRQVSEPQREAFWQFDPPVAYPPSCVEDAGEDHSAAQGVQRGELLAEHDRPDPDDRDQLTIGDDRIIAATSPISAEAFNCQHGTGKCSVIEGLASARRGDHGRV